MSKHTYFLGIGGTLMGSLAQLAKELGHTVTGSDQAIYPPMSDQLAAAGIKVFEGFAPEHLDPLPDEIVIGNVAPRTIHRHARSNAGPLRSNRAN